MTTIDNHLTRSSVIPAHGGIQSKKARLQRDNDSLDAGSVTPDSIRGQHDDY